MDAGKNTVLIVDDSQSILDSTTAYLRTRGYDVVSSSSGLGVSALINQHAPKALVLDVMMPALDGESLARLIRSRPAMQAIPIIFYSAAEEEQLYRITKATPGASYVMKSDGPEALRLELQERLGPAA